MNVKAFACKICGKEFEAAITAHPKYCPSCRKKEAKARNNARKKQNCAAIKCKIQAKKPNGSLDEFCRELNEINAEREKAGQKPLTYGEYSLMLWFGGGR